MNYGSRRRLWVSASAIARQRPNAQHREAAHWRREGRSFEENRFRSIMIQLLGCLLGGRKRLTLETVTTSLPVLRHLFVWLFGC
jgi:hypothetical protein